MYSIAKILLEFDNISEVFGQDNIELKALTLDVWNGRPLSNSAFNLIL